MMNTSYNSQNTSHAASAYQAEASFSCAYAYNTIACILDAIIMASIIISALICLVLVRVFQSVSVVVLASGSTLILLGLCVPIKRKHV